MMRRSSLVALTLVATLVPGLSARAAESREPLLGVNGFPALVRLQPGDSGEDVTRLQEALTAAGFYHSEIDGIYGPTTRSAVVAFHKYLGFDRTGDFQALDWIRLGLLPEPGIPRRWDERDYLEVDLTRQLLFLVLDGEVAQILPVSTGGGYTYVSARTGREAVADTPAGDFRLKWHQTGWECDPVTGWCVYKYWAFTDYYGIHGYRHVPAFPASHGCIRVETWDADWLESHLSVGMPLHVWSELPVIPPPPSPPTPSPAPPE